MASTRNRFDCVDVDLIFDVAFEDESVFLRDLEICFEAGIEQVSTYPLMRFGYTPFGKSRHFPKLEHQMLRAAEELANRYDYERRSVWTFNHRDSRTYTSITREFYLGCGAGAATYTGRMFLLNHFSLPAYLDKIHRDLLPIARGTEMSRARAASYYLFWQLYTGRLDVRRFESLFPGQHGLKALLAMLQIFRLARRRGDQLVLTPRGYDHYHDLERWVTYHFIEPLWADMMREHRHLQSALPELSRTERIWLRAAGLEEVAA